MQTVALLFSIITLFDCPVKKSCSKLYIYRCSDNVVCIIGNFAHGSSNRPWYNLVII